MPSILRASIVFLLSFFSSLSIGQNWPDYIKQLDGSVDKESIPSLTGKWHLFLQISTMENRQALDGHLYLTRFIGLSEQSADTLIRAWAGNILSTMNVAKTDLALQFEVEDINPKEILESKCAQYELQREAG